MELPEDFDNLLAFSTEIVMMMKEKVLSYPEKEMIDSYRVLMLMVITKGLIPLVQSVTGSKQAFLLDFYDASSGIIFEYLNERKNNDY